MRLFICFTLVLLLNGCHFGQPGKPAFDYTLDSFPQRVGTTYHYRHRQYDGDKQIDEWQETQALTAVDKDLLTYTVTLARGGQTSTRSSYMIVRDEGIYWTNQAPAVLPDGRHGLSGTVRVLCFPLRPDMGWDYRYVEEVSMSRHAAREETVEVPAGKYTAVLIEEAREQGKGELWYVPQVGFVKSELSNSNNRTMTELIGFEGLRKG